MQMKKMLLLVGTSLLTTLGPAEPGPDALVAAPVTGADAPTHWDAAVLRQKPEWYASAEARAVADSVI